MEAFTFSTLELILLVVIGVLLLIQTFYYTYIYGRIYAHNRAVKREEVHFTNEQPPLSVILSARNEAENLRQLLPLILEQEYPQFEVIVINDGSTDETDAVLSFFEERYPHLYHSFSPSTARYVSRKKLALTLGIKASKYDWVLFTEPDCRPVSNQWLKLMARNFTPHTQIVLGFSGYDRGHGWLHKRIAFDSLFSSLRYLGFALLGKPFMGIGRNMAYRKALFFAQKGYSAHLNLQRGDDDLFINKVATRENTRVETALEATVRAIPADSFKEWREEKLSYMATSRYFQGSQKRLLGLETASRILFYLTSFGTAAFALVHAHWLVAGLALLLWFLRLIPQAIILNKTATDMGDNRHYYFSLPLFDLLLPFQTLKFKLYRLYRGKGDLMRR